MRNYKVYVLSVITAAVMVAGVSAQEKTAEIDKIFEWVKAGDPGCSVAVSQEGKLLVNKAYGSADLERDVPLSPETVFDAGSIRKQFVAAAILMLVHEGKLALTDDVRKFIPGLPDYGDKITVDHLLTHTSGIRDWQPLLNFAGGDPDAMTMILRQRELNFRPGEEWSYSNSGYVLLPEIVKAVSGTPFPAFVRKRIFEPLGMKLTTYVDDPLYLIKNRALGYKKGPSGWKLDMYLGNERGGAGALFTTASDLVLWHDALNTSNLGEFVTHKLQEPTTLHNGRKLTYARGLFVELRPGRGGRLVWHTGGAAGYSARSGHLPEHSLAVAIMCNQDGGARPVYASRVFDLFLPAEEEPEQPRSDVTADLTGKAGTYFNEKTGEPLRLAVNNNTLMIAGGGPLIPMGGERFRNQRPTLYFMSEAEFELNYQSADQIEIKTSDGVVTRYRRPKSYSPTAEDLKLFAGRFYSDELMATFVATPSKDGLAVRINEANTAEFKPVDQDTFQIGGSLIRFRRDNSGAVVGFDYNNPLLRSVKFTKERGL